MLAQNTPWKLADLMYPVLASVKLDGERCIVNGAAYARSGKPFKNKHVNAQLVGLPDYDGEIIVGPPNAEDVRTKTRSLVGSIDKEIPFTFFVFDSITRTQPFDEWYSAAKIARTILVRPLHQFLIHTEARLLRFERLALKHGFEGLVLRSPGMLYKHGRCTWKEFQAGSGMLKRKPTDELEAMVLDRKALRRNSNPKERTSLGYSERSSAKVGMIEDPELLGAFLVKPVAAANHSFSTPFWVGSAVAGVWDAEMRRTLMLGDYRGKVMTVRFLPVGAIDAPVQPRFVCWYD